MYFKAMFVAHDKGTEFIIWLSKQLDNGIYQGAKVYSWLATWLTTGETRRGNMDFSGAAIPPTSGNLLCTHCKWTDHWRVIRVGWNRKILSIMPRATSPSRNHWPQRLHVSGTVGNHVSIWKSIKRRRRHSKCFDRPDQDNLHGSDLELTATRRLARECRKKWQ